MCYVVNSYLHHLFEMAANWWEYMLTPESWCCEEVRRFECLHEGVRGKFFAPSPGSSSPLTFRHHVPQGTHAKMMHIAPKATSWTPMASRRGFEHTIVQSAQPDGLGESTPAVVHDNSDPNQVAANEQKCFKVCTRTHRQMDSDKPCMWHIHTHTHVRAHASSSIVAFH